MRTFPTYSKHILFGRFREGQKIEQLPEPLTLADAISLNRRYLAEVCKNIREDASVKPYKKVYPTGVYTAARRTSATRARLFGKQARNGK